MRSLHNLHEVTNYINDDVTLNYYLATCDHLVFEEAIKDEKLRIVMDEEIVSIEKNNIKIALKCMPVTLAVPYIFTRFAGCSVSRVISRGARKLAQTPT